MCSEKSVASAQVGPNFQGNMAVLTSETSFVTSRLPLHCSFRALSITISQHLANKTRSIMA